MKNKDNQSVIDYVGKPIVCVCVCVCVCVFACACVIGALSGAISGAICLPLRLNSAFQNYTLVLLQT